MTTELWLLMAGIVLGFVHIFAQAHSMNLQRGLQWNASARDQPVPPLTGVAGRLSRALRNFVETFPLFAASVLLAHVANVHNGLTAGGAWIYIAGRLVYMPLYAFGVPYVRSLAWTVATAGIVLILAGVVAARA